MSAKNRKFQARLGMETLESRELMAGDVRVTVSGGDLVITGDSAANSIEVRQVGIDRFEGRGVSTKINGQSNARTFPGVFDDVQVALNGGNDRVVIKGNIPDDLLINAHAGNDYIKLERVVAEDVTINTGSGSDQVYVYDSQTKADLNINNNLQNSGDHEYVIVSNTQVGTVFDGTLNIDLHGGNDKVYISNVATDHLMASLYDGDDYLSIRNTTVKGLCELDGGEGTDGLNRFGNNKSFGSYRFNRYTYV